ncbi:MAG TPA: type II toxin-antitoxin system HipA family toxin [Pseudobdellovibrionaceae bacterium]|jgi:serine/threonine-protein kinase HipA
MNPKGKVYFKNQLSGVIEKNEDGSFLFSYESHSPSVSLTLPTSKTHYQSEELFPFFDGLIPEGWLLNLVQKNWKIPKNDRMALLLTTCQDCIGATHVLGEQDNTTLSKSHAKTSLNHREAHTFTSDRCLVCMEALNSSEQLYHSKCAKNLFGFSHAPIIDVVSEDLEELALRQINQRLTLTGVQRKLSLSPIIENKKERLTVVGVDGRFILKPASEDYPEMAEVEHLSMKIAELQNITVADCGLVYLASGERAYITRRFDRANNEKIQVEDFCQLAEKPTERKYSGSSESLAKIIEKYSDQAPDDKLTLFQIILFSFWIGNSDMHLKNFSLWRDPQSGLIRMSPGYDFLSTRLLITAKEDNEELALPVNGKKNKLRWSDFVALASNFKIPPKVFMRIRDQMLDSFFDAEDLVEKSFLSYQKKEKFMDLLRERSERLAQK